jgi:hypothetical protein
MDTPRFNYERSGGATSRLSPRKYSKWIQASHISGALLRDSKGSERRKIFAIVAPPMPADRGRKIIRRVLIFDNHPDSLRLVSEQYQNPDVDLPAPGHTRRSHVIFGMLLIMTLVFAMFWPLL